jgi:hypothetical protein
MQRASSFVSSSDERCVLAFLAVDGVVVVPGASVVIASPAMQTVVVQIVASVHIVLITCVTPQDIRPVPAEDVIVAVFTLEDIAIRPAVELVAPAAAQEVSQCI